jgi:hypothetical protein
MSPKLQALLQADRNKSAAFILANIQWHLQAKMLALAAPPPVVLGFNMTSQHPQLNWCWAATARSVSHYYNNGSHWTKCLVAQTAFPHLICPCTNPLPCDQVWYLERALAITSNYVSYRGPMSFAAIEAELLNGRVLGARTAWNLGGAHFVVIHGCYQSAGVNYLKVDDPDIGKSDVEEAVFLTKYKGSGTWTHAYFTKP